MHIILIYTWHYNTVAGIEVTVKIAYPTGEQKWYNLDNIGSVSNDFILSHNILFHFPIPQI